MLENLNDIFMDCLFKEEELPQNGGTPEGAILVEGITQKFGFHPGRLREHGPEIAAMLLELPDTFMKTKGGGWSFLNACMNKNGEQWTAFHPKVQELFCLGLALDICSYTLPREMWKVLPGGMPYLVVDDAKAEDIAASVKTKMDM